MAQSITSAAVGRVNRRFLLLALILAALSAVLVYAAIRDSGKEGGSPTDVPVVVTKTAIAAGTTITADMIEIQQVRESNVADQALRTTEAVVGRVARYPLSANEQVLLSKVVTGSETVRNDVLSHILESGRRGMAIETKAVIGAGGLVLPGDRVDVFWVPDDPEQDVEGAQLLAENVEVVAVQQTLVDLPPTAPGLGQGDDASALPSAGDERVRGSEAEPNPEAITVTLMLTPEQAQRVFCGEATGSLRLAVRAFGDTSPSGLPIVTCIILGEDEQGQ